MYEPDNTNVSVKRTCTRAKLLPLLMKFVNQIMKNKATEKSHSEKMYSFKKYIYSARKRKIFFLKMYGHL